MPFISLNGQSTHKSKMIDYFVLTNKLCGSLDFNYLIIFLQIDCHFHYLEITSIESKRANQLSLSVGERYYNFTTTGAGADTTEVDAMIEALHTAIRNIFPTVPLKYVFFCFIFIFSVIFISMLRQ